MASPADFKKASLLWINVAPNLPATPPRGRCEKQCRARLEEDARLVSHRCAGAAVACLSHVLVPAAIGFFFFPPSNPDYRRVAACLCDNAGYNVVARYTRWFQWADLSRGQQPLLWLNVNYKSKGEWHHWKHSVLTVSNKQTHIGRDHEFFCNHKVDLKLKVAPPKKRKTPQYIVNRSYWLADRSGRG